MLYDRENENRPPRWRDKFTAASVAVTICDHIILDGTILVAQGTYIHNMPEAMGTRRYVLAPLFSVGARPWRRHLNAKPAPKGMLARMRAWWKNV